ncbi:hypothetical protein Pcar_3325 [Syntrophotalea carbinolica DSM 2380]|uniref:Uncharacterized protein n=1 Tax=Syntrophotalea carbinolica (strain DSM 2380 / NBRC 103641 / GraBd1) TaxID=338963 RepID=Q0C6J6_SYNC1|nr:hypothetical protein Pcar_3325 [Syntrophotalea carbinolica DSM 2380]
MQLKHEKSAKRPHIRPVLHRPILPVLDGFESLNKIQRCLPDNITSGEDTRFHTDFQLNNCKLRRVSNRWTFRACLSWVQRLSASTGFEIVMEMRKVEQKRERMVRQSLNGAQH